MNRNQSYQTYYYQKNKEKKKQQRKERYQQQKQQAELFAKQQAAKYYRAEAIKILMSFKEYTELSKDKHKFWLDFNWTLQDCSQDIKEGLGNVVAIMKLREVTDNLIRDYWKTAKKEVQECLFLLGWKVGLRISEAISFDLTLEHQQNEYKNLYLLRGKRQKERWVYVSPEITSELRKRKWKPQTTNRYTFFDFLQQIKKELNLS